MNNKIRLHKQTKRYPLACIGTAFNTLSLSKWLLIGLLGLSTTVLATQNSAPKVVVSIAPLHSLVSGVMQGVATPQLLIEGGQSPHSSYLAPSAHRKIASAELLIWVGPAFELSLRKAVAQSAPSTQLIALMSAEGMHTLKIRQGGAWGASHVHQTDSENTTELADIQVDPHLWLSTENARQIVVLVARKLAEMDPEHAEIYYSNKKQVIENIQQLEQELMRDLKPIKSLPYLVFHDAYHYFEDEFGLTPVAAVTLSPERKPGARSIVEIRQLIQEKAVRCLFSEPQFEPGLMQRLAEDTGVGTAELDPLGASISPGPEQWFTLMRAMRDDLLGCIK